MSAGKTLKSFMPLFDRILVRRFAPETKTKGGIYIPEKSTGKVLDATVVAAGPGYRTAEGEIQPLSVQVGDHVLLPEYGGTPVKLEGEEFHLFRDSDILGKFTSE